MAALTGAGEMWAALICVCVVIVAFVFLGVGMTATLLHLRHSKRWLLAPIGAVALGASLAVVLAAVPAGLLAAIYVSIPASMTRGVAVVWGGVLAIFILLFQIGVFQRLV